MAKVNIIWINDYSDCDDCGMSCASGAVFTIFHDNDEEGTTYEDFIPCAACYGGSSYPSDTIWAAIYTKLNIPYETDENGWFSDDYDFETPLKNAGFEVTHEHEENDFWNDDWEDEWN